jgi:hypothetical protein
MDVQDNAGILANGCVYCQIRDDLIQMVETGDRLSYGCLSSVGNRSLLLPSRID